MYTGKVRRGRVEIAKARGMTIVQMVMIDGRETVRRTSEMEF